MISLKKSMLSRVSSPYMVSEHPKPLLSSPSLPLFVSLSPDLCCRLPKALSCPLGPCRTSPRLSRTSPGSAAPSRSLSNLSQAQPSLTRLCQALQEPVGPFPAQPSLPRLC